MRRALTSVAAAAAIAVLAPAAAGAAPQMPSSSTFGDGRPWWDPTHVLESPPDPETAEGSFDFVRFTDNDDGDQAMTAGAAYGTGRVQSIVSDLTPQKLYTVRITGRSAGDGADWGIYTWQRYQATKDGKLYIDLQLHVPTKRATAGEKIVAAPAVYKAEDVRRDGRPNKADPKCVLQCQRVPPVAAFTNYTDPAATISFTS